MRMSRNGKGKGKRREVRKERMRRVRRGGSVCRSGAWRLEGARCGCG